ncbi:MAG: hypothetical protein DRP08_05240 [Candidatus Aenigmatarchaeota archaeon]|nr:MAG: hypothetical protein DRP08_05240 [Candidatus Aenigmarchaeota archaeon]
MKPKADHASLLFEWSNTEVQWSVQDWMKMFKTSVPCCADHLNDLSAFTIADVFAYGEQSCPDRQTFKKLQVKSCAIVPMVYSGELVGFIGC